jgi:multiple antibiotic resistance protein
MAIVLLLSLFCLLAASTLMKTLGVTGVNVTTRVFGIITAALGVQFVIDGVLVVLS